MSARVTLIQIQTLLILPLTREMPLIMLKWEKIKMLKLRYKRIFKMRKNGTLYKNPKCEKESESVKVEV